MFDSVYGYSFTHHMSSFIVPELDPHVNPLALHVAARACKPFKSQVSGARAGNHEGHDHGSQVCRATGPEPATTGAKDHRAKARIHRGKGPRGQGQEAGPAGPSTRNHGGQAPKVSKDQPSNTPAQKEVYRCAENGRRPKKKVCSCAENGRLEKKEVCSCAESGRPKRSDHKSSIKVL